MKIVAAYLLAVLGGNASPDAKAVQHILASVGADAHTDPAAIEKLVSELKGKDVFQIIESGKAKLSHVSSAPAHGHTPAASGHAHEKKEEKKKEEKKKKKNLRKTTRKKKKRRKKNRTKQRVLRFLPTSGSIRRRS